MAELNPEDFNYFRQSRRRVDDTYKLGQSQNEHNQSVVRGTYGRSQGNLVRQYAQLRDQIPGGFTKRGMLNSGMYEKAWGDFKQARQASYADLLAQRDEQLGGMDMVKNQLEATRRGTLDDLEEQKISRLATIAATLRAANGG